VNHMKNVLRMKPGEIIPISDATGIQYTCQVLALNKEVKTKILTCLDERRELPSRITLFQGLPKTDKMERIIQKAV
ncbi:RsmE family RNA methyltransferase, partial [Lactonifactor longoviformis]|uniref:RsmE family RNA methyltransferase n=1 Tax=Lactonifactor longoviformis TaxID=341220 RepID=UPI002109C2BC